MKNSAIQVALTTMLTAVAFIICVVISGALMPFLLIVLTAMFSSKVTLDDAVTSPLFIVFAILGMIVSFFVLMNKLEQQNIREKQERLAKSLR
jgi:F0F1-type ATP synthase assembly protein I